MSDPVDALGLRIDDEYRPRQAVRWAQPYPGHTVAVLTAVGALLVGFLLSSGLVVGRETAAVQQARNAELVSLINARQEHVDAQAARLEELRAELAAAEAAVTAPSGLRSSVDHAEAAAGLTRVAGPGLRVTFDDAGSACPGAQQQDCRIQDTDLQLAVNTLFGLGAEAIAVNGERVIATTAIRGAGRAILVNYRVLTPPYVVEVVGDRSQLARDFPATTLASDFQVWTSSYGLGFTWEEADDLELPAFGGSVRLRSATVSEASA